MSKNYQVPGAEPRRFAFPFAAVPKGARVIIYGGGIVGKTYVQEIMRTGHCQLVAVADRRTQLVKIENVLIIKPEGIAKESYDYVFVALERQDWAVDVWRELLGMRVYKEKIRWIDPGRKKNSVIAGGVITN